MKKLLLKLAYGILKMYKEKPTNIELGGVILCGGNRFMVTDYSITRSCCGEYTLNLHARDMLEALN